jgi:hypothetical protein
MKTLNTASNPPTCRTSSILRAGLILILASLITSPFVYTGLSLYFQWLHGYGFACFAETLADVPSPSNKWIARTRHVGCSGPAGSYAIEVVLVPNGATLSFLSPYKRIFFRDPLLPGLSGVDRVATKWINKDTLELQTVPCRPSCFDGNGKQSDVFPCDAECWIEEKGADVKVTLRPTE